MTEPAATVSTFAYDAHDRPLQVKDPKGGVTTYVYNGFGEVVQSVSPDTGKTTYAYDLAGNLVRRTDARGVVVTHTYDALNRRLGNSYAGAAAENVTFRYDEADALFGKGRLTSLKDAAGTLKRTYDERGNLTRETRTVGGKTLVTRYAYDAAERLVSIVYPSGYTVGYGRDAMGRTVLVTLRAPGASSAKVVVKGVTYRPFGPVQRFTYGNGVVENATFDLAHRQTKLTTSGKSALQNLTYSYNAADDVASIRDGISAGQSQSFATMRSTG